MSAVCPACGVAVVPGYVRCPRCHAGLPTRAKRTTAEPGGTAVPQRGFPLAAVAVAIGVPLAVILVFGLRGSSTEIAATPAPVPQPIAAVPGPTPRPPIAAPVAPAAAAAAAAPAGDPRAAALELEDALRRQRLWGRVVITGARADLRSGSCGDPAMRPLIEGKASLLRGAGLTKLRCLEQSGAVVFERDL